MDRTQHVIDAIDGALEDRTVSGDAMRWNPEPQPAPVDPRQAVVARLMADPEAARRLGEQLAQAMRPLIEWADLAAGELGRRLEEVGAQLRRARLVPEPLPADPKERALRLRQQRHTGPDRDVVRQRRPRQHVG